MQIIDLPIFARAETLDPRAQFTMIMSSEDITVVAILVTFSVEADQTRDFQPSKNTC